MSCSHTSLQRHVHGGSPCCAPHSPTRGCRFGLWLSPLPRLKNPPETHGPSPRVPERLSRMLHIRAVGTLGSGERRFHTALAKTSPKHTGSPPRQHPSPGFPPFAPQRPTAAPKPPRSATFPSHGLCGSETVRPGPTGLFRSPQGLLLAQRAAPRSAAPEHSLPGFLFPPSHPARSSKSARSCSVTMSSRWGC